MKGIIWLASYPKSGNTWFRVFLANLLRDSDEPVNINELESMPIASDRGMFDGQMGFEASDLTADEIDRLRPGLYVKLAENAMEPLFMKVHDSYGHTVENQPLIPTKSTIGAIYFIRNPLDVVVSFAHHSGWDYDTSIVRMAKSDFSLCGKSDRLCRQLRQKLSSWSGHVASWVDHAPFPVCILRYEDMKSEPLKTFEKAVRFSELDHARGQIQKALEFSSFEVLRGQEKSQGFKEKSPSSSSSFFRKGEIGSWREELSEEQVRRIVHDHRETMCRFGYLDDKENILY